MRLPRLRDLLRGPLLPPADLEALARIVGMGDLRCGCTVTRYGDWVPCDQHQQETT